MFVADILPNTAYKTVWHGYFLRCFLSFEMPCSQTSPSALSDEWLATLLPISLISTCLFILAVRQAASRAQSIVEQSEGASALAWYYYMRTDCLFVSRGISFLLSSMVFHVVPTALEISLVCGILVSDIFFYWDSSLLAHASP
jgi:hypothetical protein